MARKPLDLRKGKTPPPVRTESAPPRAKTEAREARRVPLRVRRRRKRYVVSALVLVLCGAAIYAVHWASYLPQYNIQTITVSGASQLSPEEIRGRVESFFDAQGPFISPRSIFRYRERAIAQMLETDILHIAKADVTHPSPFSNELQIAVQERIPFAHWCSADARCFIIDKTGFIFAPDDQSAPPPPQALTFYGGVSDPDNPLAHSVASSRFPSAMALVNALGQAGFQASEVSIDSDTDLTVRLLGAFAVRASFGADPVALARDLRLILASDPLKDHLSEIEYVDLRFGNRVFYKLQGQEAVGQ